MFFNMYIIIFIFAAVYLVNGVESIYYTYIVDDELTEAQTISKERN